MRSTNPAIENELLKITTLGWSVIGPLNKFMDSANKLANAEITKRINFPEEVLADESLSSFGYGEYRNEVIFKSVNKYVNGVLWEVGAGNGDVTHYLFKKNVPIIAVEPHFSGAKLINEKGIATFCADFKTMNLPNNSCSNIGIFDVLEHIEEDSDFLGLLRNTLMPGGKIIITVPTHQFLFSDFDKKLGHFRRYSRNQLVQQIEQAGLEILETKFFMKALVAPAFFLRKIAVNIGMFSKKDNSPKEHLKRYFERVSVPIYINLIKGMDRVFPNQFGLSLLIVCTKK